MSDDAGRREELRRRQPRSWLRTERENRGVMQSTLATRLGVSQQALSHYENGKVRVPDDIALRLAQEWQLSEVDVRRNLGLYVPEELHGGGEPPAPREWPDNALRLPEGIRLSDLDPRDAKLLESIVDAFLDNVRKEGR